jgi:hypothetical protein
VDGWKRVFVFWKRMGHLQDRQNADNILVSLVAGLRDRQFNVTVVVQVKCIYHLSGSLKFFVLSFFPP